MDAATARMHFTYDSDTGVLRRRTRPTNSVQVGDIAGSKGKKGYLLVGLLGRKYLVHRLAWLVFYGEWPKGQVDHINGVRTDNRMCNLRDVSATVNSMNRNATHNTSGHIGVSWMSAARKWRAQICTDGVVTYLGIYANLSTAVAVYNAEKSKRLLKALHSVAPAIARTD